MQGREKRSNRVLTWSSTRPDKAVEAFLERPAFDDRAEAAAARVLEEIRRHGTTAVLAAVERFDGVRLRPGRLRMAETEIAAAAARVAPSRRRAIGTAIRRVRDFSRAAKRRNWSMRGDDGTVLGERFTPLDRVGVYVPGGEAPLVSTVVMTVTLARVAGVREIVLCTPPGKETGEVDPALLYAARTAGATEIYRVGGIQAIGMMAFGIPEAPKVRKIVGPGGAFVTAAKRQVYGRVALDLVAGPSEIAVLADETARADWVAADLLSQIEHGTGHEKALLATPSAALAREVARLLPRQAERLRRREKILSVLARNVALVRVDSLEEGMRLCNRFAPEHFELMVARPMAWAARVRSAGAVFVGPWTPEPVGDFVAGPSHVLPTGGAAAMFSGLTVDDFMRRGSLVRYTRRALREALPTIRAFADMERLDGHGRSAQIRFEEPESDA